MPTVILLDVSFSMCQPVPQESKKEDGSGGGPLLKKDLAVLACCQLLDHLQQTNKLEFVALMIYSSLYEVVVGFTRDYNSVRNALLRVGDYDKTCLHSALAGAANYCREEWGNTTPCQVVVVTDGSLGVGQQAVAAAAVGPRGGGGMGGFAHPATLSVICLASPDDPALLSSLPVYQRYVELNSGGGAGAGGGGGVYAPQSRLCRKTTAEVVSAVLRAQFSPYRGSLQCGALHCPVTLAPPPQAYSSPRDGGSGGREVVSGNIVVLGFLAIVDVSSPPAFSRHLLLPVSTKGEMGGTGGGGGGGSDEEGGGAEEGKVPSLCVLLHGGLKKESMVALCQVAPNWCGILYSWSDNKKKSNLLLSIFEPGVDIIPWLGKLDELGPASSLPVNPYTATDATPPFPVKSGEKRSYNQACVVWVRAGGLQSDVQKILRHARKLPDKTHSFYKELNRVRRAALQYGFPTLLLGVCSVLEREALTLPASAHPEAAMQLQHACAALRAAADIAMDPATSTDTRHHHNIPPLKTTFALAD